MDIVEAMDLLDGAADDAALTRHRGKPAAALPACVVETRAEVRDAVATIVAFVVPGMVAPAPRPVVAPHER